MALAWHSPQAAAQAVTRANALTSKPVAVNLVLEWEVTRHVQACLAAGARIFSFFWGDPSRHVDAIHQAGGTVLQTVGSIDEGRRAVDCGADIVIAQGLEAGGHVRGEITSIVLVPAMVDALPGVPVVAAGGIADGRGVAAALCLGACGAMTGTRFLASHEANTHDRYRAAVVSAESEDAVYTRIFDGGWPNAPHRVLSNDPLRRWTESGTAETGARPGEGEEVARRGTTSLLRYGDDIPTRDTTGKVSELARYAGQSVGLVHSVQAARDIVEEVGREVHHAFLPRFPV